MSTSTASPAFPAALALKDSESAEIEVRPVTGWTRLGVLLLTLAGFARVAFGLGAKDFWWDESLSLQRAESALGPLLRGLLEIKDGFTTLPTTDQHPFFSFLLQGALLRVAGTSEYVLRWPAAAAATALTPALFALGRHFERRGVAPRHTSLWAALLAATSPFLLWYGQEARPYALWALLTVVSTWFLLAAVEAQVDGGTSRPSRWLWVGYAVALIMMLTTHFYAFFLLPVHVLYVLIALGARNPRRAVMLAILLLIGGALMASAALWIVLSQGGGANFPSISLGILVPDLVNAFSLGLSVDISQVRWLHWFFIVPALLGSYWMMRSRATLRVGGWVAPAWLLVPALAVLVGNMIMPLYMNSRHLSLMAPAWLLIVATGLAVLGNLRRWLPFLLATVIIGGFIYSTVNYHTREEYAKDDYTSLAEYLAPRIVPGDLLLYYPPSSWRIFDYYLPSAAIYSAIGDGAPLAVHGVPLLDAATDTYAWLDEATGAARRTWVVKSGTHPYFDLEGRVEQWLKENRVQVRDAEFFSHSVLRAQLYLPGAPVDESPNPVVPNPVDVTFNGAISLVGIDPGWSTDPAAGGGSFGLPLPVTLYWRVNDTPDHRVSYRLQLEHVANDGTVTSLGVVERETYEGSISATWWDPGKVIYELTEMPWSPQTLAGLGEGDLRFSLLLYDTETLETLAITDAGSLELSDDGPTVYLPVQGPQP